MDSSTPEQPNASAADTALREAVAATYGTCAAVYVDVAGKVQILGNTNREELADLLERAAAQLRGVDESLG